MADFPVADQSGHQLSDADILQALNQYLEAKKNPPSPENLNTPKADPNIVEIEFLGQKISGSPAEIQEKIKALEGQTIEVLKEAANRATPAPAPEPKVNTKGYDPSKVKEDLRVRMDEDPVEAFKFWAKQAGLDLEQIQASLQLQAQQGQALAAATFMSQHPEFPRTREAGTVIDQYMQQYGIPPTVQGLEMAYALATMHGRIQPAKQAPAQQQPQFQQQTQFDPENPYAEYEQQSDPRFRPVQPQNRQVQHPFIPPRVPPMGAGAGLSDDELEDKFEQLSLEDMRKFLATLDGQR